MKKSILGALLPLLTMIIIFVLSFENIITNSLGLSDMDIKGALISGIVLFIPFSFLVNGIICAIKQINWKIPALISLLGSIAIMVYLRFDGTEMALYLSYYFMSYCIGCWITSAMKK
ncbi:hypothetical protein AB4E40_19195 [Clostridioides difficile]|nr:hypothetical protein [uncultured Clostridioides sp.]MCF8905992.1 hypothetical protein [Clostridioides difficile]MCG7706799.1 hypothetical protein [Clostridioides difficile]MCJ1740320.1 hypothetical protein [Clostridioides difficile]MCR1514755.1 hypothetical protein [Clostridioides difficile]MDL5136350.1 hypothetical protein [Clostridioides difficile]